MEALYYATVLSNFVRGYDKYSRIYSKKEISESHFPDRFFLLTESEIFIGIEKVKKLLQKFGITNDEIIILETNIVDQEIFPNTTTGKGRFILQNFIQIERVWRWSDQRQMKIEDCIENIMADSLLLQGKKLLPYSALKPRTISILPIAKGCEAHCAFCFSHSSASSEDRSLEWDEDFYQNIAAEAKKRGAERAVITGGGEPGLLSFNKLLKLISLLHQVFPKTILISNSYFLSRLSDDERTTALRLLQRAGLSVLSISRHHWDQNANSKIFNLDYDSESVAKIFNRLEKASLKLRWVCVLQKGAVDSPEGLAHYLDWAASTGVREICFKELYVASGRESIYYSKEQNIHSAQKQVPLSLISEEMNNKNARLITRLPWGSPIFELDWKGHLFQIAAYTEPSVFWERSNGLARSWNVMADKKVLVSLEDKNSEVQLDELSRI